MRDGTFGVLSHTIICLLLLVLISGCESAITYGDRMATAVAQGCWDDGAPTPRPVTVTPLGGRVPTPPPTVVTNPGAATTTPMPSPTALPSTTALPRCTPAPGTTQAAWPTSRPTEPQVPTRQADYRQPAVDGATIMRLPNALLGLDLAVHPVQNWPVVAAIDIPMLNRDPARVYLRAYDPIGRGWGVAQNVDRDGSHPGTKFRSVAVGVTGDGTLHVVWGVTEYPEQAMFASQSTDHGTTWSVPERIGGSVPMMGVLDMATTLDNQVFVLALQSTGTGVRAVLLHRAADAQWAAPEPIPFAAPWYGSGGALVVAADELPGHAPQLVAAVTAGTEGAGGVVEIAQRPLRGGAWTVTPRPVTGTAGGAWAGVTRGVAYTWTQGAVRAPAVTFTVVMRDDPTIYALTSRDGGRTWGMAESIARAPSGTTIRSAAPAYDPVAQSTLAIWTCCTDGLWGNAAATHYASWRALGASAWTPTLDPATFGQRVPLVSGASAAGMSSVAQAANTRVAWLAWVEDGQQVRVRTLRLDQVIPFAAYPTATPLASLVPPTIGRP